jgi:hypothetical protein
MFALPRKRPQAGKCDKLGRSAIFLVLTAHHNLERIIRQRPELEPCCGPLLHRLDALVHARAANTQSMLSEAHQGNFGHYLAI